MVAADARRGKIPSTDTARNGSENQHLLSRFGPYYYVLRSRAGCARDNRERAMAVDGNWNITMSTPMGDRQAALTLQSAGGTLTGTQSADGDSGEIFDGTVNGDDVAWKLSITNPMPLTLAFTGKVDGDSISGEMGIGPMGSFPFTGNRA